MGNTNHATSPTPRAICGYCRAEYDTFEEARACAWKNHGARQPQSPSTSLSDALEQIILRAPAGLGWRLDKIREIAIEAMKSKEQSND